MNAMITLYHVTHVRNIDSIFEDGLLPHYAKGKLKVTWLVDFERVPWALAHTASKLDVSPNVLVVFTVQAAEAAIRKWSMRGVFTCKYALLPTKSSGAVNMLKSVEEMLEAQERADFKKRYTIL